MNQSRTKCIPHVHTHTHTQTHTNTHSQSRAAGTRALRLKWFDANHTASNIHVLLNAILDMEA